MAGPREETQAIGKAKQKVLHGGKKQKSLYAKKQSVLFPALQVLPVDSHKKKSLARNRKENCILIESSTNAVAGLPKPTKTAVPSGETGEERFRRTDSPAPWNRGLEKAEQN